MDAAEIDVGSGIFECGQTYVALSRVKSLDGLYLTSFDAQKIRINKKVKDYYESLALYYETTISKEEVLVPITIEPCKPVVPEEKTVFSANTELSEEKYDDVAENDSTNIKRIKFTR
jgi:hypothetical protein